MTESVDQDFYHFYSLHYDVRYITPKGHPAQRYHSIMTPRHKATLPLNTMRQAQQALVHQLEGMGIAQANITNVSHIGTTYHGIMTEEEFMEGIAKDEVEALEGVAGGPPTHEAPSQPQ